MKYEKEVKILFAFILTLSAVVLSSWIPVGILLVAVLAELYVMTLNRIHPEKLPYPRAEEVLAALEQHKKEVKLDVDGIRAKLEFQRGAQFGRRE